jgi:hypothetical protein
LALFGKPSKGEILYSRKEVTARDVVVIRLCFRKGKEVLIKTNRISPERRKALAVSTASKIFLLDNGVLSELSKKSAALKTFQGSRNMLEQECRAFLDKLKSGKPYPTDGKFGYEVTRILGSLRTRGS